MATLNDTGFTQGLTQGDFNADGFPDLMSGNIGENRFYQNNGDGTFTDVTEQMSAGGSRWTSSVAFADLDRDGLGDFVEINYCAGDEVYSQECIDNEVSQPRSCSPLVFPAEADRLFKLNSGGGFADVTDRWLAGQPSRHGLGVVVAQIDDRDGLDLYVANDEGANQLWSSNPATDSGDDSQPAASFGLTDQATIRGVAVDGRSRSQASMGVAFADADRDGDFDLYVTHFTDDYNTFYQQISSGTWFDKTTSVGLAKPTFSLLAFGTEWFDADNDGHQELLVANGNIDDFRHKGHPLRMPTQFFAQAVEPSGAVRWRELPADALGDYFSEQVVGRALVTWDVNRDGKTDALITHLFDPVALLVNESKGNASSVRLYFKGVQSERDAIGTTATAIIGDDTAVAQVTSGDGYQCSNERVICFGLGDADAIDELTVAWPSGQEIKLENLRGGFDYIVIEGHDQATELAQHRRP